MLKATLSLCLLLYAAALHAQKASPSSEKPGLIVAIIVDQFRYDYTTRFAARYTGGLHTMLEEGAVYLDAQQDHFPTVTAAGHTTFLTGSTPATSGIIGNEWYDRQSGKLITSVEDANTKLLGGAPYAKGSSPHNLLVSTLGDEIKIADGGTSKVIGISMKDRAAILPAGHMADAAYWIDGATGNVVSAVLAALMPRIAGWPRDALLAEWNRLYPAFATRRRSLVLLDIGHMAPFLCRLGEEGIADGIFGAIQDVVRSWP